MLKQGWRHILDEIRDETSKAGNEPDDMNIALDNIYDLTKELERELNDSIRELASQLETLEDTIGYLQ